MNLGLSIHARDLVAVDIGGTHARFAPATIADDGAITLGETVTLRTADHATFADAWAEYARRQGAALPRAAAFSIAAPVSGDEIPLVNNPWVIRRVDIPRDCQADAVTVVNDFGAVGHAVATLGPEFFHTIAGPDVPLPAEGTLTVLGPGTGLGVAHVWRDHAGYRVQSTEGGHFSFAPIDALDDALLVRLRRRHGRVSAERVVAGPGIVDIHAVVAAQRGEPAEARDDKTIWQLGIAGEDDIARTAVDHFCGQLGAVAGDLALAQGAAGVVVAGGLGLRLKDVLPRTRFAELFAAKGRFADIIGALPVKLITHPQPGLFGAVAAFAKEHT